MAGDGGYVSGVWAEYLVSMSIYLCKSYPGTCERRASALPSPDAAAENSDIDASMVDAVQVCYKLYTTLQFNQLDLAAKL